MEKILIVGGGGREHALAWKMKQDLGGVVEFHSAPGNAGLMKFGECYPAFPATDIQGLLALAERIQPDLTVVGPEDTLALGLADQLSDRGFKVFGPSASATRIESSKIFAKEIMKRAGVPTAGYRAFNNPDLAHEYVKKQSFDMPVVIKADGLALGKGVAVCPTGEEADLFIHQLMVEKIAGDAGLRILVEDYLKGPECSVLVITDGENFVSFPPIRDHKPVFDGNKGPNTGGMGAIYPILEDSPDLRALINNTIIAPTLRVLGEQGTPFIGCLYAGLKLTPDGVMVVEFNARFGDPEVEVALPMLQESLLELLHKAVDGKLPIRPAQWQDGACVDVVLASRGYPDKYEKGKHITGIEKAEAGGVLIFQAGTKNFANQTLTNGGRVLNVVGREKNLGLAAADVYRAINDIEFDGMHYRKDIGR